MKTTNATNTGDLLQHLMARLREVQATLQIEPAGDGEIDAPLRDHLDSMGLVEFIAVAAEDCGVVPSDIENAVDGHFGSVSDLAQSMMNAGLQFQQFDDEKADERSKNERRASRQILGWLSAGTWHLPTTIQSAQDLDALLNRPAGWFAKHAGISQRHIWNDEDPLSAATDCALASLQQAGLLIEEVDVLLVTSEAPPIAAGLAAALHHRLEMHPGAVALEIGGACTGFLSALWVARHLLVEKENVLIIAVEAPSCYLTIKRGAEGEAAALFGDGAAACVLSKNPLATASLPLLDVTLQAHGESAKLLQVKYESESFKIYMNGPELASLAVSGMADLVENMLSSHDLQKQDLEAVIAHGGNGRMPALLARKLKIPAERVWSQTATAGNLGAATLPAAWAAAATAHLGPAVWVAVGAGITSACALTGAPPSTIDQTTLPF